MSLIIILLLVWSFCNHVSSYKTTTFNHTVMPLAACGGVPIDVMKELASCHLDCLPEDRPIKRTTITLYQDISQSKDLYAVFCQKIEVSAVYTETYTFSTIESETEVKVLDVTEDECRESVRNECPDWNCHITRPSRPKEEYHYASSTTVKETHITLIKTPCSIDMMEEAVHINPAGSDRSFPIDLLYGHVDKGIYFWKPFDELKHCPFSAASDFACDRYVGDKRIVCKGGKFTLKPPYVNIGAPCNMFKDHNGILFKFKGSNEVNLKSGYVSMSGVKSVAEDIDYVRTMAEISLLNLDSELCQLSCDMAGLEMRVHKRSEHLIRVGSDYVLAYPNNQGIQCKPLFGCHLAQPLHFCSEPTRISLICSGKSYFWDPTKAYVSSYSSCSHTDKADNLTIISGKNRYLITSEGVQIDEMEDKSTMHPGILTQGGAEGIAQVVDLNEVRADWITYKNQKHTTSTAKNSTSEHTKYNLTWFDPIINAGKKMSEVISKIEVIIVSVISIIAALLIYKLVGPLFKRRTHGRRYPGSIELQQNEQEVNFLW